MNLNEINQVLKRYQQELRHNKSENDKVLNEINKIHHQIDLRFALLNQYSFELPSTSHKSLRIVFNYSQGEENRVLNEKVAQIKIDSNSDYFVISENSVSHFESHYPLSSNWKDVLIKQILTQGYQNIYIFTMSSKFKNWMPLFQNTHQKQTVTSLNLIQEELIHSYLIQTFNTIKLNNSFLRYKNKLVSLDEGKKKIEKKITETNSLKFKIQRELDLENHIMISKNQQLTEGEIDS